jgi:phosphonate transport system substrate-binding protein
MTRSLFSVCPHDTAKNLFGWFVLNTYLQRKLDLNIHFESASDPTSELEAVLAGNYQIVYANPYSTALLTRRKGFLPVARVAGLHDEALLVVRKGETLPAHGVVTIASAGSKMITQPLGRTLLSHFDLDETRVQYQFVGTHVKAAQAVLKRETDAGFVFNETWRGLSATTKADLDVLAETRDGSAFHCFCIGPGWFDRIEQVRTVLLDMNTDAKGQAILADLGFGTLEAIDAAAIAPSVQLLREAGLLS